MNKERQSESQIDQIQLHNRTKKKSRKLTIRFELGRQRCGSWVQGPCRPPPFVRTAQTCFGSLQAACLAAASARPEKQDDHVIADHVVRKGSEIDIKEGLMCWGRGIAARNHPNYTLLLAALNSLKLIEIFRLSSKHSNGILSEIYVNFT